MRIPHWVAAMGILVMVGCSTSGNLGIVTKSTADNATLLKTGRAFQELGPVETQSCRYFLLAVIPWGANDFAKVVDEALQKSGGDALINVNVESSLYGFIPIYNVFSFACTTVRGVAVKFQ